MIHSARPTVLSCSDYYSCLNFVLLLENFKSGDERTENTFENSDHYRPWLWVVLVDQKA